MSLDDAIDQTMKAGIPAPPLTSCVYGEFPYHLEMSEGTPELKHCLLPSPTLQTQKVYRCCFGSTFKPQVECLLREFLLWLGGLRI